MNIVLQCCSLFIVGVLIIMFLREKKLDLVDRRLFTHAVFTCFVCLIFDIISVIAINRTVYGSFSPVATVIICKIYIMLLTAQGYLSYIYVSTGLLTVEGVNRSKFRIIFRWVFAIGEILILVLPIYYTCDDDAVYSYGASTAVAYRICAVFLLASVIISLTCKKRMSRRKYIALLTWQSTWLSAAVIQFLNPELLLVGFASAFGMVILYIQLENPSAYIDAYTGLFTNEALAVYIRDKYKYNMPFSAFTARIIYLTSDIDFDMEQNAVLRIAGALTELGSEPAFRIDDKTFCVVYDDKERMNERMLFIKNRKDSVTGVPADAAYILVPDSSIFSSSEEFFKYLHYHENDTQEITIADEESVRQIRERSYVSQMITDALADDRVEVFYQPFYNVKEKKFTAAEALVRIKDTDGRIVPPAEFIPMAEENGQIIQLGMRIFEKVCRFLATGEGQKYGLEYVEVNVSAAQFDYDNPAKFVMEYIKKYNLNPGWINLEITETVQLGSKKSIIMNVDKLTKEGVTFSLDDFGTGRSNLDYFVNMPVQNIKFDRSFTQGYFQNEKVKYVLKGMADMMHEMNMMIVSEGIETKEQLDAMIDMGIEYIQGFYFSKPIPESDFIEYLKSNNG